MNETTSIASADIRDRVVISSESQRARHIGLLALTGAFGGMILLVGHAQDASDWYATGRLTLSLSLSLAVLLVARGILLGRPVTVGHAGVAAVLAATGLTTHLLSFPLPGDALVACAGLALTWPVPSRRDPAALERVWALVEATHDDPLAPFAMQSLKSYYFSADGTAAIAYCARLGLAVVSGDPIGQRTLFPELSAEFATMCRSRGWRIVVLGCGEQCLGLWRDRAIVGQSLRPIPIGRDVVIDVGRFTMAGRQYRNLRQAVQRTHNAGITTEVVDEQQLDETLTDELAEVLYTSHRGARVQRGFSMILDHALEGRYPGVRLIIARDSSGRIQGFQRYASSGGGSDVTLDVPWRRPGAPNGIDERLSVDMIEDCKNSGGRRLSLAFGAFPELFDNNNRGLIEGIYYVLIHLGHSLIKLEPLYRYLRKFHAFGERRYVLLSLRHIPIALVVLLSLEFMPRRRHVRITERNPLS
ncbi:MAG: phosphatidylglycerol lysyltransferase domain-containing protein [Mycobacterium sp.]